MPISKHHFIEDAKIVAVSYRETATASLQQVHLFFNTEQIHPPRWGVCSLLCVHVPWAGVRICILCSVSKTPETNFIHSLLNINLKANVILEG